MWLTYCHLTSNKNLICQRQIKKFFFLTLNFFSYKWIDENEIHFNSFKPNRAIKFCSKNRSSTIQPFLLNVILSSTLRRVFFILPVVSNLTMKSSPFSERKPEALIFLPAKSATECHKMFELRSEMEMLLQYMSAMEAQRKAVAYMFSWR